MKNIFAGLLFAAFAFSCGEKKEEEKKQVAALPSWLEGEWVSEADNVMFTEKWTRLNDSLMEGKGMATSGNDTLFAERLEIRRVADTIYYIPTVSNQNEGKAVWFRFTAIDSAGFLAENPGHDFPKTIQYRLKGQDSIYATLKGIENGKERMEIFPMKKSVKP